MLGTEQEVHEHRISDVCDREGAGRQDQRDGSVPPSLCPVYGALGLTTRRWRYFWWGEYELLAQLVHFGQDVDDSREPRSARISDVFMGPFKHRRFDELSGRAVEPSRYQVVQ